MLIADSQVHIWAANTPERPWPPGPAKPHRPVPFLSDDLLREMNAAGVNRAVIVPPTWDGERNDLALEAARQHPDRIAVMGRMHLAAPGARDLLSRWREQPGMLGIRCTFAQAQNQASFTDGSLDWLWAAAEKHGVHIMLNLPRTLMPTVDQILERHPKLKLVIDHLAISKGKKDDDAFADLDKLLAVAKRPNIAVKASSLPSYTTDSYPYRRLHPYIRRVYDAFGPKRMFWGSDLTKLPCTYRQMVTMFTEEMPWFTTQDMEWIMGRGLCEWLGWKLP